jgi:hypothetical protein
MADEPKAVSHVSLPVELVNATIQYLLTRPGTETFELVLALKVEGDKSYAEQQKPKEE